MPKNVNKHQQTPAIKSNGPHTTLRVTFKCARYCASLMRTAGVRGKAWAWLCHTGAHTMLTLGPNTFQYKIWHFSQNHYSFDLWPICPQNYTAHLDPNQNAVLNFQTDPCGSFGGDVLKRILFSPDLSGVESSLTQKLTPRSLRSLSVSDCGRSSNYHVVSFFNWNKSKLIA